MPWIVSGQPGRMIAIFVIVPLFLHIGMRLRRSNDNICALRHEAEVASTILIIFALVFFVYESLWITGILQHPTHSTEKIYCCNDNRNACIDNQWATRRIN